MTFDANGIIMVKPLQPAFLARASSQNNMAVDSNVYYLRTETFDQNADYDTSTYTFTAPVTGRYQFKLV